MTSNEIRKLLRAQPFQPFTLHLADGRTFDVPHPERMIAGEGARIAIVSHDRTYDLVDLLLVTSAELRPPETSAA